MEDKEYEELKKTKRFRCRFCHPFMGKNHNEFHCVVDGWEDENIKTVSRKDCEQCDKYNSRYIEYPLTINGIKNENVDTTGIGHKCGALCEIKPCGEEHGGKSYIGIYIGDLPICITTTLDEGTGILKNRTMNNPAIFVPALKKIVYGCESWWREISSVDDFKGISDEDINNTWYVKLLKELSNKTEF